MDKHIMIRQLTKLHRADNDDNCLSTVSQQINDMLEDWAINLSQQDQKGENTPITPRTIEKEATQNALTQILLEGSQLQWNESRAMQWN